MHHGQSSPWRKQQNEKGTKIGGKLINFAKIGGICNLHHWLRGDGRLWPPHVLNTKWHCMYNLLIRQNYQARCWITTKTQRQFHKAVSAYFEQSYITSYDQPLEQGRLEY